MKWQQWNVLQLCGGSRHEFVFAFLSLNVGVYVYVYTGKPKICPYGTSNTLLTCQKKEFFFSISMCLSIYVFTDLSFTVSHL